MKKRVLRLTESDLHNIIKTSVSKIIKENIGLGNVNFKNDIAKGEIESIRVSCNDEYANLQARGISGAEYDIIAYISCDLVKGMASNDYDVPSDPNEEKVEVVDLKINRYDEETNDWLEVPYMKDPKFESFISNYIDVDFTDYEDWGGHIEPEDKMF